MRYACLLYTSFGTCVSILYFLRNYVLTIVAYVGIVSGLDVYKRQDINLVFIRTQPKEIGSYANGLALEMASRLIDEKSKYVVTFHLDIAVAGYGWLKFMLSKLNEKVRACGFRLTKERVKEGVLHVCGYLIDFQLFKKLNLSFMPELPDFCLLYTSRCV